MKALFYLQKVEVAAVLKRKENGRVGWKEYERVWEPHPITPTQGVIIGKRTIQNGSVHYEEMIYFSPQNYIQAYLVSFNMNDNPVYVRSEDIKITN